MSITAPELLTANEDYYSLPYGCGPRTYTVTDQTSGDGFKDYLTVTSNSDPNNAVIDIAIASLPYSYATQSKTVYIASQLDDFPGVSSYYIAVQITINCPTSTHFGIIPDPNSPSHTIQEFIWDEYPATAQNFNLNKFVVEPTNCPMPTVL